MKGLEPSQSDLAFEVTRTYPAPRKLVSEAWTDPRRVEQWWTPRGCRTHSCTIDPWPGGKWRLCMVWPDETEHWQSGVYQEVVPPERLSFTFAWEDERGNPKHEMFVVVMFAERGGETELTLRKTPFLTPSIRDSHLEGWNESLDGLGAYLDRLPADRHLS